MPALKDLHARISLVPEWNDMYNIGIERAKAAASKIPLIHVTEGPTFLEIVSTDEQELLPSDLKHSDEDTIRAEKTANFNPCLYFYAGRACPAFGDIALAFNGECETSHTGSATPFDTGGLVAGYIKWNKPDSSPKTLNDFIVESLIPLDGWREAFADFIAAYFLSISDYWMARPCRQDPEEIFLNDNNKWRAWVFEIRFHEGHNVCGRVAWSYSEGLAERLRETISDEPPLGAFLTPLQRFFQGPTSLTPDGSLDFCDVMEKWVLNEAEAMAQSIPIDSSLEEVDQ